MRVCPWLTQPETINRSIEVGSVWKSLELAARPYWWIASKSVLVNYAGGIYGSYLAETTRGYSGGQSTLCGYPASVQILHNQPRGRTHESTDTNVSPG